MAERKTVVSGIRPTGNLHLGNYYGAVKNFIAMQENYDCFFFIADVHSLTTHPTPDNLHNNVKQVLAEYLALGLDPNKCSLFVQSDVPEILELYAYMNMNAYLGELERSASFKDKIRAQANNVNAGLLTYPVLMAVDILIHHADFVPVGKDQEQHLEMTRTFANRFNHLYKVDYFKEPQAFNDGKPLVKVPGLSGEGKMSKSAGESSTLFFVDEESKIRKKLMRAKTDSGPTEPNSQKTEDIQNLFDLMQLLSTPDVLEHYENAYNDCSIRYGDFKKQLAEDTVQMILPFQEKIKYYLNNEKLMAEIALAGAEKAQKSARQTIKEVREIIGFRKFASPINA